MRRSTSQIVLSLVLPLQALSHTGSFGLDSTHHPQFNLDGPPVTMMGRPSTFQNISCLAPFTSDAEEYDEPETLCVYTAPSFWHSRGISVFTDVKSLAHLHRYEALRMPHLQLSPTPPHNERPYSVVAIPGKGMAGIANTYIAPGTTILAQHPALIISSPDDGRDAAAIRSQFYKTMIGTLPKHNADAFLALSSHFDEAESSLIDGIIHTNSFAIDIGSEPHKAIFTDISRFNHDCRPNAEYTWSEQTLTMNVRAVRFIQPGEEITISYISQDLPTQERIDTLHSMWGFRCSCKFCTLPPHHAAASDSRVSKMAFILDTLERGRFTNNRVKAAKIHGMVAEYIRLANQERLHVKVPDIYTVGAKVFSDSLHHPSSRNSTRKYMSHLRMALNYTSLALQAGLQLHGGDWADIEEMTRLGNALLGKMHL